MYDIGVFFPFWKFQWFCREQKLTNWTSLQGYENT
jgi:hypothetical protein